MSLPGNVITRVTAVRPPGGQINDILWLPPSSTRCKGRLGLHLFTPAHQSHPRTISGRAGSIGLVFTRSRPWGKQTQALVFTADWGDLQLILHVISRDAFSWFFSFNNFLLIYFCCSLWRRSLTFLFPSRPSCKTASAGLPGQHLQIAHEAHGNTFMCVFLDFSSRCRPTCRLQL